eukprot:scaffold71265_cov50-Attheya_sp.AAC.1
MRHSDDSHLSDSSARWWPEWHEYSNSSSGLCLGRIVCYGPCAHPDPSKFIRYTDEVPLSSPHCRLLGPFDFAPRSATVRPQQIIPAPIWEQLTQLCLNHGVLPPTVGG